VSARQAQVCESRARVLQQHRRFSFRATRLDTLFMLLPGVRLQNSGLTLEPDFRTEPPWIWAQRTADGQRS